MDSLEEQLEQLQLMTQMANATLTKKVGPSVPPKPKKSSSHPQSPAVPKSCQIKQSCEPSYSTILQQNNYEAVAAAAAANARRAMNNTYSNVPGQQPQMPHPIKKLHHEPVYYDHTNKKRVGSATSAEFIPGRIYENQKIVINNVTRPNPRSVEVSPPSLATSQSPASHSPQLHIYSNASPIKKFEPIKTVPSHYSNISFEHSQNYNRQHPPPPIDVQISENYQQDEEFPPPPSPVSSSYSELRRATDIDCLPQIYARTQPTQQPTQQASKFNPSLLPEYVSYGGSQASSTYESIYEPINPRPPSSSQMSNRSNYSLYTPQYNGGKNQNKESEVDELTDALVISMDQMQDADTYGVCVKCGEKIVGENSGCTAMDQIYHIGCFTCYQCQINLQGKPFYALDGSPYCEEDYLSTLEKCSVCMNPILERILRATGKPYHPQCFCCVVCSKTLDGVPFTVDATNQIHCIEDFHNKFAPRCCCCLLPIMPEPGKEETVRVVALDRSFHLSCYKCEDCGLLLSSEAEGRGCYPLDDHILCKSCNAKRVQTLTNHMTTEL